ncbi:class I SAM-dependent methyltransferase [Roseisalinus antarcticus]|uniref:class I SAM-dependent methyltransferase n=1 Tax=Roseisalinus antarcticus TaxID=254357 RepID=UPI0035207DD4
MPTHSDLDSRRAGQSHEHDRGRWSRLIAREFLDWLAPKHAADWLEIVCGSGALTSAILQGHAPNSILATDASEDFVAHARKTVTGPRVRFETATAQTLPPEDDSVDIVTSALVLNLVPDRRAGLVEMQRVLKPGGVLSFHVRDHPGGGIGFIDAFRKAAASLDPDAGGFDGGCTISLLHARGPARYVLGSGSAGCRDSPDRDRDRVPNFETFRHPFSLGAGPAPGDCMSIAEDHRNALGMRLAERLDHGGPVRMAARPCANGRAGMGDGGRDLRGAVLPGRVCHRPSCAPRHRSAPWSHSKRS